MPKKILIRDDDSTITDLMSALLKTHAFDVITTKNGKEGIKMARENRPDVILLEWMMPEIDGWQAAKTLRTFSNPPILILSAINDPRTVSSVLDAGADDFLVKPVPISVLVAHIRKMIRQNDSMEKYLIKRSFNPLAGNPEPLQPKAAI